MPIQLPKDREKPKDTAPKSLFLYGSPKIGKTTILAGLPDNLIMDLEGGTSFVEALKVEVNSLAELGELGRKIIEAGCPYTFTTTDTTTELEIWCHNAALLKYKKSPQGKNSTVTTLGELDYGLGYGLWRQEFRDWIVRLRKLSKYSIFIGHVKDKIITKNQSEVAVKDINLTGQIKAIAASSVDAVGYIFIDPKYPRQRKISFLTSDEIVCGNRVPHLEGREFVISEKLEDNSVITYWENIYPSINKKQ